MSHYRCQAKTNNGKRCKKKKNCGSYCHFHKNCSRIKQKQAIQIVIAIQRKTYEKSILANILCFYLRWFNFGCFYSSKKTKLMCIIPLV